MESEGAEWRVSERNGKRGRGMESEGVGAMGKEREEEEGKWDKGGMRGRERRGRTEKARGGGDNEVERRESE